jgi:phosphate transport system substrate-binding protein
MNEKRSVHLIISLGLVALLVFAIMVAGCTSSTGSQTPATTTAVPIQNVTIKISGSTTVLPIVQAAADAYEAAHPGADIEVSGGGSGVGMQAIAAKTVDIGMTSAAVTPAQLAANPNFVITTIAHDGIAIIVNPANTIKSISLQQVSDIYTGKITTWTQITGAGVPDTNNQIVLIGRDSASGTRTFFDQFVLNNTNPSSSMLEQNSNGAVAQSVAQTPQSIGYVSIGFLSPTVTALPISVNSSVLITPSAATVADKTYPIHRDLYLVTQGQPTGLTGDFINFILSPAGQQIVSQQGYVPLS